MNIAQHLVISLVLLVSAVAWAQETEDIPAPRRSLLRTAATKDFNKPLFFDQVDNGLVLPPMELEYELAADGHALKIGNILISDKTFSVAFLPLGQGHPNLAPTLGESASGQMALVLNMPEDLMKPSTIEMVSRTGKLLWSHKFSPAEFDEWNKRLDGWRKDLIARGVPSSSVARTGIFGARYAFVDAYVARIPLWDQKDTFRFCITQTEGRNSSRICSARYGINTEGGVQRMQRVRIEPVRPRVLLQGLEAPLKKTIAVTDDSPTSFYAEMITGETYEFVTIPTKFELMDIADTVKPHVLRIVGYDTRPVGRSIILNPDQYSKLTKLLGFESTIGDPRKFWAAAINSQDPKIYIPGEGGGIFKQRFELSQIPSARSRIYLDKRTPMGTYTDGIKLYGRKQPSAKVTTDQNSVRTKNSDPTQLVWYFKAVERGEINRSYLTVDFEGKTYRSYFELYKGFPRELSGRFSGVQTAGTFIIMGEVAYNHWFEDLFGWSNYWVSRQRWGLSAKYFKSFNELKINKNGSTAPLSALTVDLKYRLNPGLWGRDETLGALVSYQEVTFDKLKAPMLGMGAFWARSMPKGLDDLFNLLPAMRYPKWVDVEFIYYSSSMDSNVKLNLPMSLNFHGKVLWTERFFGEAGFGIKRFSFEDSVLRQKAELNTFYGTVGLGLNF